MRPLSGLPALERRDLSERFLPPEILERARAIVAAGQTGCPEHPGADVYRYPRTGYAECRGCRRAWDRRRG